MKKGTQTTITVNGKELEAIFLGKGQFSKAYRVGDFVYTFTKNDYSKEAVSMWAIENEHTPTIERIQIIDDNTHIYRMPYYEPLNAKDHPTAWAIRKELQNVKTQYFWDFARQHNNYWGFDLSNKVIECANVSDTIKECLQSMIDAFMNYDVNPCFEFPKRNLAVDDKGNIIFLDVLFDINQCR